LNKARGRFIALVGKDVAPIEPAAVSLNDDGDPAL